MEVKENAGSWSEELLQTMVENTMEQWVNKGPRCRGEEELSQLDLVFYKNPRYQAEDTISEPNGEKRPHGNRNRITGGKSIAKRRGIQGWEMEYMILTCILLNHIKTYY